MMKIASIKEAYYESSDKVSEIVRNLDFAGIAIIWIFRTGGNESGGIAFSKWLLIPLGLFVLSLVFDLLHYVYKTIVWGILNTHYYGKYHDEEKDVPVSGTWNYVAIVFFWIKTALVTFGYFVLLMYILCQIC